MEIDSKSQETFSHPKDRSLEAYKAWISEIAGRLTTQKTMFKLTEEEWRKSWQEFWQHKPKA